MKKIFLLLVLFVLPLSVFAIPGVVSPIPTEAGQYVYYKDSSFTWETYIGFIQYDEATYGIRYYAPKPETGSSDIEILITIDATQDYVLMTGEKIVSDVIMDDNTVINYLHDIFYELAPRRKNVEFDYILPEVNAKCATTKKTVHNDFYQYGGDVLIEYDLYIPVFNVRSIKSGENIVFEAVTMGQLTETGDSSFSDFKGFPVLPAKTKNDSLVIDDMDSKWVEQNGFAFIGSESMFFMYDAELPSDFMQQYNISAYDYMSKDFSMSRTGSYVYLPEQEIRGVDEVLVVSNTIYMPDLNQYIKDFKILQENSIKSETESEMELYNIVLLSSFYEVYYSNKEDFDELLNSFIN